MNIYRNAFHDEDREESAFAEHCLSTGHDFNKVTFKLIYSIKKGCSMHRLEEAKIIQAKSTNKNLLNDELTHQNSVSSEGEEVNIYLEDDEEKNP